MSDMSDSEDFIVERVVEHRPQSMTYDDYKAGKIQKYFVKWQAYLVN